MEKTHGARKILIFAAGVVLGGIVSGLCFAAGSFRDRERIGRELRERAAAAYRDIDAARAAQREAQDRTRRLQEELARVVEYAERIEEGTRGSQDRAGELAAIIDRAVEFSGNIESGIGSAQNSLDESRELLAELGSLLQRLPDDRRGKDSAP